MKLSYEDVCCVAQRGTKSLSTFMCKFSLPLRCSFLWPQYEGEEDHHGCEFTLRPRTLSLNASFYFMCFVGCKKASYLRASSLLTQCAREKRADRVLYT